ncbi:uncharacterized protein OCT59_003731 [Rhizophagus irregularis]|uniref:Uncharacterized protein n=2 Tax=Rhizophagus irregularis TaxID=588596 RepID=A0A015JIA0_RHIIW|nr:hypothetical protein GLOIN_2v1483655 [Rhizophagus irregularis DAOM 181602=DAOM 197198]EXX66870.1 hypothetical protein RirG_119680 [Rhizophagus irregularis DAOM 197198w]UZO12183.1 hypothetical protein OCT59_003731 [Rhizophagus irregularis]POG64746.1 hypothetical protein GLOIN_2v1483655 [Rhizophagus irregularis DAOM 181602=DAOM 197198]CAG8483110.1 6918_t:CDS:1 [Rhizophagus irregularis]GBC17513.2 hypothetical protein RIR_jg28397.t1 [Rhizophagus irregularis DAOM 181602=DAOM 197198]|eukprot:XP_025171612.1 hypothetical protein GLOIN_2v1483655 [Rhizophagus irregularis DAOM 181602=DAOM 197198]
MFKSQNFYIILLQALCLFFGIFFGLGYPEIKRAGYISTNCTIDDKTILSKYCCYKECSYCGTANALIDPICSVLMYEWNSIPPQTCAKAVATNSSLANVCPINNIRGECNDGYYCCSARCDARCSSCYNRYCCKFTFWHSCEIICPTCYSAVLTVIYQKSDNLFYTSITTNITTEYLENINAVEQILEKYPISSTVQCFYNPKDPFQVLLDINFTVNTWVAVGITASFPIIVLMYGTWDLFSENTTIFQGYEYRVLIMEIALWCGTIIPLLLILIDLIPFTNGKVLWTLAVIGVAIGWAPVHTVTCMRTRDWSFISAFTVTTITWILPFIMFSIIAIYASNTDIHTYMLMLAIITIPLGVNIIIFVFWDLFERL